MSERPNDILCDNCPMYACLIDDELADLSRREIAAQLKTFQKNYIEKIEKVELQSTDSLFEEIDNHPRQFDGKQYKQLLLCIGQKIAGECVSFSRVVESN